MCSRFLNSHNGQTHDRQGATTRGCFLLWVIKLIALGFLPWTALGQLQVSALKTGTPPAWVEWTEPEAMSVVGPGHEPEGQVLALFDTQVNVDRVETFVHMVKDITAEAGVRSGANLEFTWDPSYQELIVHQVTIHRGRELWERLDPAKFRVIQQEADLDRQIYNGCLSAVLFLEDIRVGDRIEFAYTLRGRNPSLGGRYADAFIAGLAVPIGHRRIRILCPEGRTLYFRGYATADEPKAGIRGNVKDYLWDLGRLPAVVAEDQVPSWFPAFPWIQASEFRSWSELASWAAGLYITTNLDAPELKAEIAQLRRPRASAEETLQNALEFTQNGIRYLGIEFGPNSYHPTDPVTVLKRRFGDCKDKAFLLCTLLRGLGFTADPVLVSTTLRHTLPGYLPAPFDFDHVIVRATVEGRVYWLDPTRPYQRGPLTQRYRPAYGFGLLVRAGEIGLTPIPVLNRATPESYTTELFRVGGQKEAAQLTVTSTFKGFDAEWMRAVLSAEGHERLAKGFLNDYARFYPGVRPAAPMAIEDATNSDTLILRHAYSITNFWTLSADQQRCTCQFFPTAIQSWVTKPAAALRSMPMELSFPRRRVVVTQIELPRVFRLSDLTNTITGPGAELRLQHVYQDQTMTLTYEYMSLTNFIPVARAAEHLASLDRMENALGYSLLWQNMDGVGSVSQFNWPIFVLALSYAAVFSVGAGLLCRHQSRLPAGAIPPLLPSHRSSNSGLGGWLILVGVGLVFGPLRLLINTISTLGNFALWKWHALTNPGGVSYQPAWAPVLTLELLGQISILILAVFVLTLFFRRRRIFPRWFIALVVLNAIFVVGDMIGLQMLRSPSPETSARVARNLVTVLVGCGIWIPYMLVSRRVKATFVK